MTIAIPPRADGTFRWIVERNPPSKIPGKLPDHRFFVSSLWFCIPEHDIDPPERMNRRWVTKFGAYCGAPPGVRCRSCNSQQVGHDPGDEDPRSP